MLYDSQQAIESYLQRCGITEVCLLASGRQGALTAGAILAKAVVQEGKHVRGIVHVRGERANSPVSVTLAVGERSLLPSCAAHYPTEVVIFDETLYDSQFSERIDLALQGLKRGTLMVGTPKNPEAVEFPYDFEGTVATVDARRICKTILKRDPPPFGTAMLGLYARATATVSLETLREAIEEHFPGELGRKNAQAATIAYEEAMTLRNVKIKGRKERGQLGFVMPFEEVPEFHSLEAPNLPGISGGNSLVWREELPTWNREKCLCGPVCVVETYCPEGVIRYQDRQYSVEEGALKVTEKVYEVDYEYCKGCGVCARECVHGAITMKNAIEVYGR